MAQWKTSIKGRQQMVLRRLTNRLVTNVRLPCPVEASDGDLTVVGKLDFRNGRFGLWEVTISSATGPVTGEKLRRVPIGDIVRTLAMDVVGHAHSEGNGVTRIGPLGSPPAGRGRGPSVEQLEYLSDVYALATAVGDPPTKAVAAVFGISVPTATRWASRARAKDLLPVSDHEES